MPEFQYKACNRAGQVMQGHLTAANRQAAAHALRTQGLWVTQLEEQRAARRFWPWHGEGQQTAPLPVDSGMAGQRPVPRAAQVAAGHTGDATVWWQRLTQSRLSRRDTVLLCRQLQVMLAGGLPLHEAVRTLAQSGAGTARQRFLQQALTDLQAGRSLADSCRREPQAFPAAMCELISVGERSGGLQEILARLADYLAVSYAAGQKMQSALLYPVLLGVFSLLAIFLLSIFVLPAFADLLTRFHTALPWPTVVVLTVSRWLQAEWYVALAWLTVLGIGAAALLQVPAVRLVLDRWRLQVPLLGRLELYGHWLRLCDTLAVLLESGIRLDRALQMLPATTGNRYLQLCLRRAAQQVVAGQSWQRALQSACPAAIRDMAAAGEASGHLPEMLRHAADLCRVITTSQLRRLEALAQPVAILVMGSLIGFILLAVALPLLDAMTAIS